MMTHFTTGTTSDVSELLQVFSERRVLLLLVSVSPRYQKTGLLEEQGDWIASLWKRMLEELPDIVGCRVLWNTLFFAIEQKNAANTDDILECILSQQKDPVLQSICVTMEVGGNVHHKLRALDIMQLETSSMLNFGTVEAIKTRFIDGELYTG